MTQSKRIVVIGGGISGITASIEAAEAGGDVLLVEQTPWLGGRVAQMNKYFPKQCPPACGLEISLRRLKQHEAIECRTGARVTKVAGKSGAWKVSIEQAPRFVNEKCTACGACVEVCPESGPDPFNAGLGTAKAVRMPVSFLHPMRYAIDSAVCKKDSCGKKCVEACAYGAIDLDQKAGTEVIEAATVVWATGWEPYDVANLEHLGAGKLPNVISNLQMERMASLDGPTGGKIGRLSGEKPVERVAFVQCAGSRDENHMRHCSGVCCSASLKQARYVRESLPEAKVTIFYIDIRTPGRLEDFFVETEKDEKLSLVKGKVAFVTAEGDDLVVEAEDVLSGRKVRESFDLVVLATGLKPADGGCEVEGGLARDEFGFIGEDRAKDGLIGVGCARRPVDVAASVRDATGAALKALQHCTEQAGE